ncbi:neurotrypsin isoform X2 [Myotis yumanensis]|uniref:neurotrypsin isoform X2 n=1 Tax=Myotis yumanensis TaxID=159337 RepID=UPI0038D0D55A
MTPARFVVALMLGALPAVVGSDPVPVYPLHYRHRHRPPAGPPLPYRLPTPRAHAPHPRPAPRAQRPPALHAPHAPPTPPGGCPAGGPWANVTDFGAPCLRWADVPPLLERLPPADWAPLRGQRHNFCRSPDGAGRPWCFYRNARGRGDWGHCDCGHGAVRLRGGADRVEGTVEVYANGAWGAVCSSHWDDADAAVVCHQLRLGRKGVAEHTPLSGLGRVPVHWSGVRCRGDEESLQLCARDAWRGGACPEAAAVRCSVSHGAGPASPVLRLAGGSSAHEGRVELYHAGQWGTVCDDQWDDADAEVVCRQLGLRYGKQAPASPFGESAGPIWLDEVSCSGRETSLLQCSRLPWGRHDCSHREDVGVACAPRGEGHRPSLGFPIRLVDGENEREGRVEVFLQGQWGTICDDGWTDRDAAVTCRQLGYRGPARARAMAYFGEGRGPIHLDNVACTGGERALADCLKQEVGRHNCRHSEDAGVICDYFGKKAPGNGDKAPVPPGCGLRPLHSRQKRIVGGKNSLRGGWPWQVSLRLRSPRGDGRLLCGATLLSSCWVLTAAHCFKRYGNSSRSYAVRVGDYHTLVPEEFEEEIGVQQIVIHGAYRPDSSDHDIALVRLQGPDGQCARLSSHVLPACLPLWRERPQRTAAGCHITGWGDTGRAYARTLQQAAVPLLPRRRCEERYQGRFTGRMLCAGSLHGHSRVDSCQGDSGGPLVCERPGAGWAVYGVTSWGYGCGAKGSPGVYTKVSAFVPWIKSVTKL